MISIADYLSGEPDAYVSIDALCACIRVEQSTAVAIVDRRAGSRFVRETLIGIDAVIALPEIECELALADLYDRVKFPASGMHDSAEDATCP